MIVYGGLTVLGIVIFNALMTKQKAGLALPDLLKQLDEIHSRLLDYVRGLPEEQFTRETRFRRRLRLDTYSHYPKHANAMQKWRQERFSQQLASTLVARIKRKNGLPTVTRITT